ncbi:peptide ABC transporter substrate-binding protein [Clostridium hydrogenum]|uniref:peptide ABC transporter substrate-binding protein n=1 Tax=Clostridium hydrogenum TaxID=2855764 RepID=UPI001F47FB4B|nr:peptide ABC transporter substrate-binding protein [Clostridium hydrogenum]
MKKYYKIIIYIIIMNFVLSGCVEKKSEEFQTSNKESYLVYDIGEVPESFSKFNEYNSKSNEILKALFTGLVCEDSNTMQIKSALAEKWDVSKDKTEYTFHIKNDAKWSDGTGITASDFVDFFKSILSSKYGNSYAYELRFIYGAKAYNQGKADFNDVAINALDDKTLRIRLNNPCNYFLSILSRPEFTLREFNGSLENWKKEYKKIKYTGPYTLTNVSEDTLLITKNQNYAMKDEVISNKLKLKFYNKLTNISAYSITDFDSDTIDMFSNPPTSEIERLKKDNQVKIFPTFNVDAIYFNLKNSSVTNSVDFRRAISAAIDRKNLIDNLPQGVISPCYNFVDKKIQGNITSSDLFGKMDLKEIASELTKSGYANPNKVTVVFEESSLNRKMCQLITDNINKNIKDSGANEKINFDLKGYNRKDINEILKKGEYDIYFGQYNIAYNNPESFLEMWNSNSPFNITGYSNIAYDDFMYSLSVSTDKNKIDEYSRKMYQQLFFDMPMVPICYKNNMICAKKFIGGISEDKYGALIISQLKYHK